MKILCICPIGIGNYLLAYPACQLLHRKKKEARLHLLALRNAVAELALGDPLWEAVHVFDPTSERKLRRRWAFIAALAAEGFDASLSFFPSNNWQYNLLPFVCRVRERFAFEYPLKKGASLSFLNSQLLPMDPAAHDIQQNLQFVGRFTLCDPDREPVVFPTLFSAAELDEAKRFLKQEAVSGVFVGVHAGSSNEHGMDAKRWDPMRFGELAGRVCSVLKAQALIFGGRNEEKIKHIVKSVMRVPFRVIEPRSLRMTAALLHECALLLCNDSGLMHLAASMGVPTAAVFGPTDERRNGPVGTNHLVLRKAMDGFPIWTAGNVGVRAAKTGIDPMASLKALTVNDAWEQLHPWLGGIKEKIEAGHAR